MTTTYDDVDERTRFSRPVPEPWADECLCCFLYRILVDRGCLGGLMWSGLWRDLVAPQLTGLEDTLRAGGGFCDCEVLANVHWPQREPAADEPLPPCLAAPDSEPVIACALFC